MGKRTASDEDPRVTPIGLRWKDKELPKAEVEGLRPEHERSEQSHPPTKPTNREHTKSPIFQ